MASEQGHHVRDYSLLIERVWPYAAALSGAGVWAYWGGARFPEQPDNLLAATGNTVAVIVGFLAAAKAIVLSVSQTQAFKKLAKAGYSGLLFSYFYEAIAFGLIFLVVSIVGFFFGNKDIPFWYKFTWVIFSLVALFCFARVVRLLFKLLRHV